MSQAEIDELGSSADDAETVTAAHRRSNERLWSTMRPLCLKAVGNAEVVELLGAQNCVRLIEKASAKSELNAAVNARRQVGEVRAGIRTPPEAGQEQHPVFDVYMALTGEAQRFEADLAESYGPDQVRHIARNMRCVNTVR